MHSFNRMWTSFVFSNSGLIFSGVIASFKSGSPLDAGWGGIDLTDPVFGDLGSLDNDDGLEGLTPAFEFLVFDVERGGLCSSACSSTFDNRVG